MNKNVRSTMKEILKRIKEKIQFLLSGYKKTPQETVDDYEGEVVAVQGSLADLLENLIKTIKDQKKTIDSLLSSVKDVDDEVARLESEEYRSDSEREKEQEIEKLKNVIATKERLEGRLGNQLAWMEVLYAHTILNLYGVLKNREQLSQEIDDLVVNMKYYLYSDNVSARDEQVTDFFICDLIAEVVKNLKTWMVENDYNPNFVEITCFKKKIMVSSKRNNLYKILFEFGKNCIVWNWTNNPVRHIEYSFLEKDDDGEILIKFFQDIGSLSLDKFPKYFSWGNKVICPKTNRSKITSGLSLVLFLIIDLGGTDIKCRADKEFSGFSFKIPKKKS